MDLIKSIVRRATRDDKLNIIVVGATHERYESNLAKTGHNFFSIKHGKQWDIDYAPIPTNYHIIDQIPYHEEFDLILVHTSDDRIHAAQDIQSYCHVPILRHCHVLPDIRYNTNQQIQHFQSCKINATSFISSFNRQAWGSNESNGFVIEHGMDVDFWAQDQQNAENVLMSVVNYWADRDWACGWEIWKQVVGFKNSDQLPIKVFGKNEGLSKPAESLEHLRQEYHKSKIFLNTSLHSPIPMSLMEAMACGCAIVSTATCMIPEIIEHKVNGLISNNPLELKEYCKMLLDNPDLAKELGQNAQKTIKEKYNLDQFVNKWNHVFNEVLYK